MFQTLLIIAIYNIVFNSTLARVLQNLLYIYAFLCASLTMPL